MPFRLTLRRRNHARQLAVMWLLAMLCAAGCGTGRARPAYAPLDAAADEKAATVLLAVDDRVRKREIPLKVYLPAQTNAAPVVVFSHGLGGSRMNNTFLGEHWASRGYVAVFMQHHGSDEEIWKDKPRHERLRAMRGAVTGHNLWLRMRDVVAVLDQLEQWQKESGHVLAGRLDVSRVGMSGHSFGAATTQAVSGQRYALMPFEADKRIRAAVMFSPNAPESDAADKAFGQVALPWLLMTGTEDKSLIRPTEVASRLKVFPNLPPGGKYELVLKDAEHSAFGDRALPGDRLARNPNHHRVMLALTTAFWDAYLRDDKAARAWLDGDGARSVLEPADRWQRK